MKTVVFGLVVEGVTDLSIMQGLISQHLVRHRVKAEFQHLQPESDATMGKWSDGGWGEVMRWCRRYSRADREGMFLQPLFEGVPSACDAIIFQLDSDVIESVASSQGIAIPQVVSSSTAFDAVAAVLDAWISPGSNSRSALEVSFPAVWATETWVLAGVAPSLATPEIPDPVPELLALFPELEDQRRPGKLRKSKARWDAFADGPVWREHDSIVARCPQLQRALNSVVLTTQLL